MLVAGNGFIITWSIPATADTAKWVKEYYDRRTVSPDGSVTYFEGTAIADDAFAGFTPPTATTAGSLTLNPTFNNVGLYTMEVLTGTSTAATVLSKTAMNIVAVDTTLQATTLTA